MRMTKQIAGAEAVAPFVVQSHPAEAVRLWTMAKTAHHRFLLVDSLGHGIQSPKKTALAVVASTCVALIQMRRETILQVVTLPFELSLAFATHSYLVKTTSHHSWHRGEAKASFEGRQG